MKKHANWLKNTLVLITILSILVIVSLLINFNILTLNIIMMVIFGYFIISTILILGVYHHKIYKPLRIASMVMLVLILILNSVGSYYLVRIDQSISSIGGNDSQTLKFQIYALKESGIKTVKDLDYKEIAIANTDYKYLDSLKKELSNQKVNNTTKKVATYQETINSLIKKDNDLILINKIQVDTLKQQIPNFDEKVQLVHEIEITANIVGGNKVSNIAKNPFVVYISGIDTYGSVDVVSRSDVNILLVVNPVKSEILLVNMPRDLFVYIPSVHSHDKLTHTGIMGIDAGIETIENFFDTKINYYIRLNFSSIINIIDKLGGVTVDNPFSFYTGTWGEPENRIQFDKGILNLDGHQAMVYARERYSLPEGDVDRARNQRRIIEGLMDKLTSTKTLLTFDSLLSEIQNLIQTDMPTSQIKELIRNQIDNGSKWKIYAQEVKGYYGSSGGYYSPNQRLSVAFPIIESRLDVINQIENMLNGESVSEKIIDVGTVDYKGSR